MNISKDRNFQDRYFKTFWKAIEGTEEGKSVGQRLNQFLPLWGNSCELLFHSSQRNCVLI